MEDFDSDKCVLGMENKTRIGAMEKVVEKFVDRTDKAVGQLTNHYSKRLPGWATIIITLLGSLVTGLAVLLLKG
jgi:hypothetical protein